MKFLIFLFMGCSLFCQAQTKSPLFTKQQADTINKMIAAAVAQLQKNIQNVAFTGTQNTNDILSIKGDVTGIKSSIIIPDENKFNVTAQGILTLKTDYDASLSTLQKTIQQRPSYLFDTALMVNIVKDTAKVNRDRVDAQYRAMYKADQLIRDTARITRDSMQLVSDVVQYLLKAYKASDDNITKLQNKVNDILNSIKIEADNRRLIIQQLLNLIPNLQ